MELHDKNCDETLMFHTPNCAGNLKVDMCSKCKKVRINGEYYDIKEIVLLADRLRNLVDDADSLIDAPIEEYRQHCQDQIEAKNDLRWYNALRVAKLYEMTADEIYREWTCGGAVSDETRLRVEAELSTYEATSQRAGERYDEI